MTLDWQQIVNILITAGFGCVGYFYSQIIADAKKDRQISRLSMTAFNRADKRH